MENNSTNSKQLERHKKMLHDLQVATKADLNINYKNESDDKLSAQ